MSVPFSLASAVLVLASALAADVVAAERAPEQVAEAKEKKRPDLSGYWELSRKQHPPDPGLIAKLPPNTVIIDDTGAPELPPGDYGGLKVKPAALAAARAWKPEDDMTLSKACQPPSIVYATQGPFPFEIHQGTDLIVFKYEYFDLVRVIFMDGRGHPPPEAPHSKTGHSIGYWDGDELVVDTTHLSAATITNNGLNHSDKVHVVERFKLSPDGKTLMSTMWFEDPEVLENNGARYIQWTKKPGEYVYPYECDPTFGTFYSPVE